jgi:hypothetical protein
MIIALLTDLHLGGKLLFWHLDCDDKKSWQWVLTRLKGSRFGRNQIDGLVEEDSLSLFYSTLNNLSSKVVKYFVEIREKLKPFFE